MLQRLQHPSIKRCSLTVLLRRRRIGEQANRAQHDALGDELHHDGHLVTPENSHLRKVNEHGLYEEHTPSLLTHPPTHASIHPSIAGEAERHTREEEKEEGE